MRRASFSISLFLCGIVTVYFTAQVILMYCQTGLFFPDDAVVPLSSFKNERRLERCANRSRAPWKWEITVRPVNKVLRIGLICIGEEIATFVDRLLFLPLEVTKKVHFVRFNVSEMDAFEQHGYPAYLDGYIVYGGHFHVSMGRWPHLPKYGMIGLSDERCFNGAQSAGEVTAAFGFLTYGDCALVDNINFFTMPLGPYLASHPTFQLGDLYPRHPSDRSVLVNGRFTMTPRKPSRREWLLTTQRYCNAHGASCALNTDWLYYSPFTFAKDRYVHLMNDAIFTLCPSGNNFEQYRIWEAIFSGSIPIVEDVSVALNRSTYLSPAYGTDYYCVPSDVHALLKESGAPVLYVKHASQLPALLSKFSMKQLNERQHRLIQWRQKLLIHYQLLLMRLVYAHFL